MKNESQSRSEFFIQVQGAYRNTLSTESLTSQGEMAACIEPERNM